MLSPGAKGRQAVTAPEEEYVRVGLNQFSLVSWNVPVSPAQSPALTE